MNCGKLREGVAETGYTHYKQLGGVSGHRDGKCLLRCNLSISGRENGQDLLQ